jgi:3'(2'), 5'-bisphosphate nucleotidase/inositol polyphosphate 1-phosphatase
VANLVDQGSSAGGSTGRHWVLDPIDGTRGFVGGRQYAVCLGLLQEGRVVLGVLGCPNLPQTPITDDDCDEGQAARSFSDDNIGTVFAASKGQVRPACQEAGRACWCTPV